MPLILIIVGIVARWILRIALAFASLPGRLFAYPEKKHDEKHWKVITGIVAIVLAQSFVYLLYISLITKWSPFRAGHSFELLTYIFALLYPILAFLNDARKNLHETESACRGMPEELTSVIGKPEVKIFRMILTATCFTSVISTVTTFVFILSKLD